MLNGIHKKVSNLIFSKILEADKSEGADFKYNKNILKFQPKNTQIRHFWSQIYGFLFLHQTLQQDKSKDTDSKDDNIFFSNSSLKTSK